MSESICNSDRGGRKGVEYGICCKVDLIVLLISTEIYQSAFPRRIALFSDIDDISEVFHKTIVLCSEPADAVSNMARTHLKEILFKPFNTDIQLNVRNIHIVDVSVT